MLTQQEIEQMFGEMGLATEEDRTRFIKLAKLRSEATTEERQMFIRAAGTTSIEERPEDGELD